MIIVFFQYTFDFIRIVFSKYLLNACSVLGTELSTGVTYMEDLVPSFKGHKSKERHRAIKREFSTQRERHRCAHRKHLYPSLGQSSTRVGNSYWRKLYLD